MWVWDVGSWRAVAAAAFIALAGSHCSALRVRGEMAGFVTEALEEREITLYHHILFMIFGLGPWNVTSALFAQLPLVLPSSPQMAQLPSYMDVATNMGNAPMLIYLFFVGRSEFAKRQPQSLNAATVYVLFALGLITAAGFAGLWDTTVHDFSLFVVLFSLCGGIVRTHPKSPCLVATRLKVI